MERLIDRRIAAEVARDVEGILATCAPNVEQDVAGREPASLRGHQALAAFYRDFLGDLEYAVIDKVRRLYGEHFALDESVVDAIAHGRPFDLEGYGRPVRFRVMRIFEFDGALIRRESIWADIDAIRKQLAPPASG